MKRSFFFCFILTLTFALTADLASSAQPSPVKWSVKTNAEKAVTAGDEFKVQVTAQVDSGWHIYSTKSGTGPIATSITVPDTGPFKLAGDPKGPGPEHRFDENFGTNVELYEGTVDFLLPVRAASNTTAGSQKLFVKVRFQACNATTCLLPNTVTLERDVEVVTVPSNVQSNINGSVGPLRPRVDEADSNRAYDFSFTDFAGKRRGLSEFRGKFVLLDFWATWCKPCLADIPKLKELYQKYKDAGFEIVGMDAERLSDDDEAPDPDFAEQQAEQARKIVTTRGVIWTQATADTAVPIAKKVFAVKALPTKILLDKNGRIVARIGENDDLVGTIEKLIAGKR